ncbi:MAG TPA: TOBE domain-containing protein [Clostridia bacterium]|nr:TOBE domain-containing protein [Clostridia bacterium]
MKISGRNQLQGKVTSVETDNLMAKVTLEVSGSNCLTATITKEAVNDLGLTVGDQVKALVKASSVMIMK